MLTSYVACNAVDLMLLLHFESHFLLFAEAVARRVEEAKAKAMAAAQTRVRCLIDNETVQQN